MSTYETVENAYLTISSIRFAYRLFGTPSSPSNIPLVFNMHFRGTMDYWDPLLLNPIAARRTVLLVDNVGVGASSGSIPDCFTVWAKYMVQIIEALGFTCVDVFGFSMGGYIAQLIALQAPGLVRKLVIAGSGPSAGPGVKKGNAAYFQQLALASEEGEVKAAFLHTFFAEKEEKQKAGEKWWERMTAARASESRYLTGDDVDLQLSAIVKWYDGEHRGEGSFDRLAEIRCPVLVAGARNDMLVPVENSYLMWQMLVNSDAHLHLYPDSGHGFLNEYHAHFAGLVNAFLDEPEREDEDWF